MIKRIVKIFLFILLIFGIYKGIQIHHDVKQVMQYRSLVREVLAEEDTTANENLILAMIYTETKGREDDVMQASESASGETNTISDNKASIRQGIQTLSDELKEAKRVRHQSKTPFSTSHARYALNTLFLLLLNENKHEKRLISPTF